MLLLIVKTGSTRLDTCARQTVTTGRKLLAAVYVASFKPFAAGYVLSSSLMHGFGEESLYQVASKIESLH